MTNQQALLAIASAENVVGGLLAAIVGQTLADAILAGTSTPAPLAGSLAAQLKASKDAYDAAPTAFVSTQANVDALDVAVDAIAALTIQSVTEQSGLAYDALQAASPDA